jgi:dUTP pyrophosphatase
MGERMKLKFKKLNTEAVIPKRATPYDAGLDLTAVSYEYDSINKVYDYGFGLAVEIPEGHVGLIFPRSSIYKTTMALSNAVGVIDSKYRGELRAKFYDRSIYSVPYKIGERIAQIVIIKYEALNPVEVDELDMTNDRGGGFGSTNGK